MAFPGFRKIPKQENPIMIAESDPSKGASQLLDSRAVQKAGALLRT